jgi:hypothetical protein
MAAGGGASTGVFLAMTDLHPALHVHRRIVVIDIVSQQEAARVVRGLLSNQDSFHRQ